MMKVSYEEQPGSYNFAWGKSFTINKEYKWCNFGNWQKTTAPAPGGGYYIHITPWAGFTLW
jgi:hypothetical protein